MESTATLDTQTPETTEKPPPSATPDPPKKTTYAILESRDGGQSWHEIGTQVASGRESALRHQFPVEDSVPRAEKGEAPILWQAIPVRSWKALKEDVPPPPPPSGFTEA